MKAEVYDGGVVKIESGSPTEAVALRALVELTPFLVSWSGRLDAVDRRTIVEGSVEFRPQDKPTTEVADLKLKQAIEEQRVRIEDLKELLDTAFDDRDGAITQRDVARAESSSLQIHLDASLAKQGVVEERNLKLITQRDAARLFADDEIAARAEAEKERDALKDQLGMEPSERFALADKWHNEKERRQAAEAALAKLRTDCRDENDRRHAALVRSGELYTALAETASELVRLRKQFVDVEID